MPLQRVTRDFMALVERETGYPVRAVAAPELPTLARVQVARGPVPAHIVQYRPARDGSADYLICYQCGFVLRQFENPPDARFELTGAPAGRAEALNALTGRGGMLTQYGLPAAEVEHMADLFFDGLVTHLRSVPIGMRIAEWLADNYPELHEAQRTVVLRELGDARATLDHKYRDVTPDRIFKATQAISAAHGQFWAERYGLRELATPWQFAGFDKAGRLLLDLWRTLPAEPAHDRRLVEAWAETLGVLHWLQWIPYVAP